MEDGEVFWDSRAAPRKNPVWLNVVAFFDEETTSVDPARVTDAIYLDLCKAFNTVSHNILPSKLESDRFHGFHY